MPPPIRGPRVSGPPNFGSAVRAIEAVKEILPLITAGSPIIRRGPAGEVHIDVPIMYMGFALDRVHYDPYLRSPSPKGRPVSAIGVDIDPNAAREIVERAIHESTVLEGAEFREPEAAWVVPVAWNHLIIAHIKVSMDGSEIVPDYALTEEAKRYAI